LPACGFQWLNDLFIGIAGFIRNHGLCRNAKQQCIDTFQITDLSRCQVKLGGLPKKASTVV